MIEEGVEANVDAAAAAAGGPIPEIKAKKGFAEQHNVALREKRETAQSVCVAKARPRSPIGISATLTAPCTSFHKRMSSN